MRYVLMMLALCWASPLWADTPTRLRAAFEGWIADVKPPHAVLIAKAAGQEPLVVARGWSAKQPVVLASLSKAITAVCIAKLSTAGKLDVHAFSADILGYGAPDIPVSGLLTHTSGLGPDQTQLRMHLWLDGTGSRAGFAAERALARPGQTVDAGTYYYNNENYAVLGEIIAKTSGRSYRDTCRDLVLRPANLPTARVSDRVGATLPWGGWEMSVADYAAFMDWAFGQDGVIGAQTSAWPAQPVSGRVSYGMGMFQRSNGPGYDHWHFGSYCFPLRLNAGAYAARIAERWTIVAAYDACLTSEQMRALNRAVGKAVQQ